MSSKSPSPMPRSSWSSGRSPSRAGARCASRSRPAASATATPWSPRRHLPRHRTIPRVPGHEIAGLIDAVGADVTAWSAGQRVGVGWHGGDCGYCDPCRRGDFVTCRKLRVPGITLRRRLCRLHDRADRGARARSPTSSTPTDAAPLLCAGITTFNALRNSGARPGDLVAILGHRRPRPSRRPVRRRMGFHTVAIARGQDKEPLALAARRACLHRQRGPGRGRGTQKLGGAKVILATVTSGKAMTPLIDGLGVDGKLIVVGASPEPIEVNPFHYHRRAARGPAAGRPAPRSIPRTRCASAC